MVVRGRTAARWQVWAKRPRPSLLFFTLLGGLLLLASLFVRPAPSAPASALAVTRWLGLTDPCLVRDSPAARNPTLADPALPLQLVVGGLDLFPAPPLLDSRASQPLPLGGRIAPGTKPSAGAR